MSSSIVQRAERLAIYAGIVAAIGLGLSAHVPSTATAQNSGAAPSGQVRIATADVLGLVDRMMATDRYTSAHQTQVQTLNKTLEPLQQELQALSARYQSLAPDNPERAEIEKAFGAKQQQLQEKNQDAVRQDQIFRSTQAAEAYQAVIAATDRTARELGYSHVIATRAPGTPVRAETLGGTLQELLARPLVRGDQGDDLTDRVATALLLPPVTKATPAPGDAGATPGAPGQGR
ncbi:MAG: OmpH family outer membrane protein [Planctomycetota bacterium]|nr:OmpH family outer membrane protein [Planctomycetota bacterium]